MSWVYVVSVCHRTHRVCAPLAGPNMVKTQIKTEPSLVKFGVECSSPRFCFGFIGSSWVVHPQIWVGIFSLFWGSRQIWPRQTGEMVPCGRWRACKMVNRGSLAVNYGYNACFLSVCHECMSWAYVMSVCRERMSWVYVVSVCHRTHRVCAPLAGPNLVKTQIKTEPSLVKFGGGLLKPAVLFGILWQFLGLSPPKNLSGHFSPKSPLEKETCCSLSQRTIHLSKVFVSKSAI